jgi:hypothetical protein
MQSFQGDRRSVSDSALVLSWRSDRGRKAQRRGTFVACRRAGEGYAVHGVYTASDKVLLPKSEGRVCRTVWLARRSAPLQRRRAAVGSPNPPYRSGEGNTLASLPHEPPPPSREHCPFLLLDINFTFGHRILGSCFNSSSSSLLSALSQEPTTWARCCAALPRDPLQPPPLTASIYNHPFGFTQEALGAFFVSHLVFSISMFDVDQSTSTMMHLFNVVYPTCGG